MTFTITQERRIVTLRTSHLVLAFSLGDGSLRVLQRALSAPYYGRATLRSAAPHAGRQRCSTQLHPHITSTFCVKQKADAIPTLHYTLTYFRYTTCPVRDDSSSASATATPARPSAPLEGGGVPFSAAFVKSTSWSM